MSPLDRPVPALVAMGAQTAVAQACWLCPTQHHGAGFLCAACMADRQTAPSHPKPRALS